MKTVPLNVVWRDHAIIFGSLLAAWVGVEIVISLVAWLTVKISGPRPGLRSTASRPGQTPRTL
jgi:hypothetical protein